MILPLNDHPKLENTADVVCHPFSFTILCGNNATVELGGLATHGLPGYTIHPECF